MQVPIQPIPRSPSPLAIHTTHVRLPPSPASPRDGRQLPPPGKSIPWNLFIPIVSFRITDAMFYAVMFPIITDMVTSFDVARDQIGFYAGFGEGVLMLVEAAMATTWAKLADRWGRRPCMLWGQLFAILAAGMVGFSTKVWHVVFWRAVLGLSPAGVLNKILASEISNPSNRNRIFSIFSPSFSAGMLVGTFLGGQLAHPYGRMPSWLGGTSEFWRAWPYALPNVVTAVMGAFMSVYGYYTLVETRPPVSDKPNSDTGVMEKQRRSGSMADTMKVPGFLLITVIFCSFQITNFAYDGIFTVYTYTDVKHGGLGLPVDTIGMLYSYGAALYIIIVPTLLPPLQNRLGAKKLLEAVFGLWMIVTLLIPLSQWAAGHMRWMMWMVVILSSTLKCFAAFAWPMCDILTMNTLEEYPDLLATGSAISLIGGAFGRAIGPSLSGWIYSMSTEFEAGSLGRQMSWISMLAFGVPPMVCVVFFKEPTTDRSGYEGVPLNDTGRDSFDEDLEEPSRAKATGADV